MSQPVKNKLNEWLDGELKPWDISRDAPYFGFKIPGTEINIFMCGWMPLLAILQLLNHGQKQR